MEHGFWIIRGIGALVALIGLQLTLLFFGNDVGYLGAMVVGAGVGIGFIPAICQIFWRRHVRTCEGRE